MAMIKDPFRQAISDTFESLPNLPLESLSHYGQVAFLLRSNTNPHSPPTGLIVYNVELVKRTKDTAILWPIEVVWRKGKGILPNFPYKARIKKHGNLKLISDKLN
jgi:hypothetical protein